MMIHDTLAKSKLLFLFLFLTSILSFSAEAKIPIHYSYTVKKHKMLVEVSYAITEDARIEIKRTTHIESSGKKIEEYIIVRPITVADAEGMYKLIDQSRKFLTEQMDMYVKYYGSSEENARAMIQYDNSQVNRMSRGIFYKKNKNDRAVMVGCLGYHSPNAFRYNSVDIFYWVGDEKYTKVKGLARVAAQAFIDWLIALGWASRVVIAAEKDNQRSINVAKKLKMKKVKLKNYHKHNWPYGDKKKENMVVYTISAQDWEKYHWKKAKRRKGKKR